MLEHVIQSFHLPPPLLARFLTSRSFSLYLKCSCMQRFYSRAVELRDSKIIFHADALVCWSGCPSCRLATALCASLLATRSIFHRPPFPSRICRRKSSRSCGMKHSNFFHDLAVADISQGNGLRKCYEHFCGDDDAIDLIRFRHLAKELFTDAEGKSYDVTEEELSLMFEKFDCDGDRKIDEKEFQVLWTDFIAKILRPKSALIVIDVQNDFIDGSLAIRNCPAKEEGAEVVTAINNLLPYFDCVIYSYDWHPADHVSFVDNVSKHEIHEDSSLTAEDAKVFDTVLFQGSPKFEQKLWPRHCVQNTWGSELNSQLKIADGAIFIYKGVNPNIDSYSAFWDNQKKSQTNLDKELKSKNITDVYICGLAYDYCVGSTALHALEFGYRTILVEDACRGVDQSDILKMRAELTARHALLVNSDRVQAMMEGRDRAPTLAITTIAFRSCDRLEPTRRNRDAIDPHQNVLVNVGDKNV